MKKILLIDDDEELLELLEIFLSRSYDISTASNAVEGLVLTRKAHFDLIITDYRMPIMDGASFLKILRTEDQKIKIIVTSSEDEALLNKEFVGLEVTRFLKKPINFFEIETMLYQTVFAISISE